MHWECRCSLGGANGRGDSGRDLRWFVRGWAWPSPGASDHRDGQQRTVRMSNLCLGWMSGHGACCAGTIFFAQTSRLLKGLAPHSPPHVLSATAARFIRRLHAAVDRTHRYLAPPSIGPPAHAGHPGGVWVHGIGCHSFMCAIKLPLCFCTSAKAAGLQRSLDRRPRSTRLRAQSIWAWPQSPMQKFWFSRGPSLSCPY